ncbi:isopentenyl-diphosphate Delta-isomerase [Arcanobacterium phocisimile]|uniref:Isopentenyl-diphosphate Delta-isomerase n=1 Tax=Arcanobacterium phocisimile TaxID=1302235 RepID=A0ABX7IFZ6_9ACTO|nr:isopentenyl-diphosphate Delta-isomerase [Arcanobacterium phocisimile]QRV01752.1 isopentenyl-diphosphate Delta-isomerase [Arcanobacterium phocisimile]
MTVELVVLCNEAGQAIGTAPKQDVHTTHTPLHKAFSCYIFDPDGHVLLTRRALSKLTWPGVWTNSVCGHPGVGESDRDAIDRRAAQELGITGIPKSALTPILPDFSYLAEDSSGVQENEVCPVYAAFLPHRLELDLIPAEVMDAAWHPFSELQQATACTPFAFSPWMVKQLSKWPKNFSVPSLPGGSA